jgi:CRISPR/Cas system-associated protein Cas5 (RAMP superfamily)
MDKDDKELRKILSDRINKFNPDIINNPSISGFIFTLINIEDRNLASLFINIYDISFLYETDADGYTPLMLACFENIPIIVNTILYKIKKNICNYYNNKVSELNNKLLNLSLEKLNLTDDTENLLVSSLKNLKLGSDIKSNTYTEKDIEKDIERCNRIINILETGNFILFKIIAQEELYIKNIMEKVNFEGSIRVSESEEINEDEFLTGKTSTILKTESLLLLENFPPVGKCVTNIIRPTYKTPSRRITMKSTKSRIPVKSIPMYTKTDMTRNELQRRQNIRNKNKEDKRTSRNDSGNVKSLRKSRKKSPRKSKRKSRIKSKRKSKKKSKRNSNRKSK